MKLTRIIGNDYPQISSSIAGGERERERTIDSVLTGHAEVSRELQVGNPRHTN
jgi:hypothetical protein